MPRVRTDAQGRYRLANVPKGFTFKVVAAAQTADGKAVALQSIAKSDAGGACDVTGITTLVSETVSEGSNGLLGTFDPATFSAAVADTKANIAADEVPTDWSDRQTIRANMRKVAKRLAKLQKAVDTLQAELAEAQAKAADLEAALAKLSPAPASPVPSAPATPTPDPRVSATATPAASPMPSAGPMRVTVVLDGVLKSPKMLILDGSGHVVVADKSNDTVRLVGVNDGVVSALNLVKTDIFTGPVGVAMDGQKNLYVSVHGTKQKIIKITPDGQNSGFAGGDPGYVDGPGGTAQFSDPSAIDFDSDGNLYVADTGNHCIRKIAGDRTVTTLAGSATAGAANGVGKAASFNGPRGLAVTNRGVVFVADTDNHLIRRIAPDGTVTTLAGSGSAGRSDGVGTAASFNAPGGLMLDGGSALLVADSGNGLLRRIDILTGAVTTVALSQSLKEPVGLARDGAGRLWVSDATSNQLLRLDP
jgi:sugar lactone lactonase YvrE